MTHESTLKHTSHCACIFLRNSLFAVDYWRKSCRDV